MSDKKNNILNNGKRSLGRGLAALLEDADDPVENSNNVSVSSTPANFIEIELGAVEINSYNPRLHFDEDSLIELAESIRVQGIIQPITVRRLEEGKYQIISGERRYRASKLAGLKTIPAFIRIADDQQMLEMALIENIQREDLNAIEVALSYQRLLSECNLKQEELGERVGKNRSTVNNYLRLLKLPPTIQAAVRDQRLSMGHARTLINVDNVETQLAIFKQIIEEDLSVRKVEELVRKYSKGENTNSDDKAEKSRKPVSYEIQQVQTRLGSHFGTRVSIKTDDNKKGEIRIPFVTVEDLNRILDILKF